MTYDERCGGSYSPPISQTLLSYARIACARSPISFLNFTYKANFVFFRLLNLNFIFQNASSPNFADLIPKIFLNCFREKVFRNQSVTKFARNKCMTFCRYMNEVGGSLPLRRFLLTACTTLCNSA